jgi:hypothetical protein
MMGSPLAILRQLAGLEAPLLSREAQEEFTDLQGKIDEGTLAKTLGDGFPFVTAGLFQLCRDSLDTKAQPFSWLKAGNRLASSLAEYRRVGGFSAATEMFRQAFRLRVRAVLLRTGCRCLAGKTLTAGGRVIAIAGGNDAERADLLDDAARWLGRYFSVAGMRPGRSAGDKPGKVVLSLRQANRLRQRGMVVLLDGGPVSLIGGTKVENRRRIRVDEVILLQAEQQSLSVVEPRDDRFHFVDASRPRSEIVSRLRFLLWDCLGREGRAHPLKRN